MHYYSIIITITLAITNSNFNLSADVRDYVLGKDVILSFFPRNMNINRIIYM